MYGCGENDGATTTTILSIDVGIKHLALCLLTVHTATLELRSVDYWNVLNIAYSDTAVLPPARPFCNCVQLNGRYCGNQARYRRDGRYFCAMHCRQSAYPVPQHSQRLSKYTLYDLHQLATETYRVPCPPISRCRKASLLAVLRVHLREHYLESLQETEEEAAAEAQAAARKEVREQGLFAATTSGGGGGDSVTDIDLFDLGKNIARHLDHALQDVPRIHRVVVENQIGPLASKMKTVQGMLTQYFVMSAHQVQRVDGISASHKLRKRGHSESGDDKDSYAKRKQLGVQECRAELAARGWTQWISFFDAHKKKDDLADAFLQGLAYLERGKPRTTSPLPSSASVAAGSTAARDVEAKEEAEEAEEAEAKEEEAKEEIKVAR